MTSIPTSFSTSFSVVDAILRSIGEYSAHSATTSAATTNPSTHATSTSIQQSRASTERPTHSTGLTGQKTPSSSRPLTNPLVKKLLMTLHFFFPHELLPALDLIDRGVVKCLVLESKSREQGGLQGDGEDEKSRDEAGKEKCGSGTTTASGLPPQLSETHYTPTPPSSDSKPNSKSEIQVFYVQSASAVTEHHPTKYSSRHNNPSSRPSSGRFRNAMKATNAYYEVRLDSWNCSCAAFAFAVLKELQVSTSRSLGAVVGRSESAGPGKKRPWESGEEGKTGDGDGPGEWGMDGASEQRDRDRGCNWAFGGTATLSNNVSGSTSSLKTGMGMGVPVCKHILAALIVKAAPGLLCGGDRNEGEGNDGGNNDNDGWRREVRMEEMAGWAAGWGD